MLPLAATVYTSALEQALAPQIKRLLDRTSIFRDENTPVGFSTADVRQAVRDVVRELKPAATNRPAGPAMKAELRPLGGAYRQADRFIDWLEDNHQHQSATPGSITIAMVTEAHYDLQGKETADQKRARELLSAATAAGRLSFLDLIVLERDHEKMYKPYPPNLRPVVSESNIPKTISTVLEQGLTREQRDLILAGYLLLVLAGGNQATVDTVMVLRGEEHTEFFHKFEYLAYNERAYTELDWVARRPRMLVTVKSLVK
jgi:hypothetical protein